MLEDSLQKFPAAIPILIDGVTPRQIEPLIAELCGDHQWDLMAAALLTAAEIPARLMINCLLDNDQYAALIPAACLRRQQRRLDRLSAGGAGAATFRDWDAESSDEGGVPEEIRNELEDISASASARRQVASFQAAEVDRDPLREYIIAKLAERISREPEALKTMIVIARAAAWEETRRAAAMKVASNRRLVDRMVKADWTRSLVEVAISTNLQSAKRNIAGQMAAKLEEYVAKGERQGLEFLAENAADAEVQARARAALDALGA